MKKDKFTGWAGTGEASKDKKKEVHLRIPGDLYYLSLIRNVIVKLLMQVGVSEGDAYRIEMAVDEACANVIEHAYKNKRKEASPLPLRRADDLDT